MYIDHLAPTVKLFKLSSEVDTSGRNGLQLLQVTTPPKVLLRRSFLVNIIG